jgi:hypothetical protein
MHMLITSKQAIAGLCTASIDTVTSLKEQNTREKFINFSELQGICKTFLFRTYNGLFYSLKAFHDFVV